MAESFFINELISCSDHLGKKHNAIFAVPMKVRTNILKIAVLLGLFLVNFSPLTAQQNPFEIQGRAKDLPAPAADSVIFDSAQSTEVPATLEIPDTSALQVTMDTIRGPDSSEIVAPESPAVLPANPFEQDSSYETLAIETADTVIDTSRPNEQEGKDSAVILEGLKELSEHLPQIQIDKNQNVLFIITVLILLFLAVLLAVNRSMINKSYRAIANDNFLRFLFREYKSMPWLYWIFYIYFFVNGGLFIYLTANHFDWLEGQLSLLILCIALIAVLYIGKQISLQVLAGSFPVEKETQLYGFVTMLINILLGVVLTPINLVGAFAPEPFAQWALWVGITFFIGLYLFRQLKGLFIAGRFLHSYKFHFFIYLCTAEIAPLLIIGKLAFDKIGV